MQKKLSPWCKKAKIAMIQNDISVNDLAEELGCSRCYLSSTLNGKKTSIEIRRRISDYLILRKNSVLILQKIWMPQKL